MTEVEELHLMELIPSKFAKQVLTVATQAIRTLRLRRPVLISLPLLMGFPGRHPLVSARRARGPLELMTPRTVRSRITLTGGMGQVLGVEVLQRQLLRYLIKPPLSPTATQQPAVIRCGSLYGSQLVSPHNQVSRCRLEETLNLPVPIRRMRMSDMPLQPTHRFCLSICRTAPKIMQASGVNLLQTVRLTITGRQLLWSFPPMDANSIQIMTKCSVLIATVRMGSIYSVRKIPLIQPSGHSYSLFISQMERMLPVLLPRAQQLPNDLLPLPVADKLLL